MKSTKTYNSGKEQLIESLRAFLSIIIPHHIDHPHPTRQKINVNACARPTHRFTTNEPIRARAPSCCENRGIPKHKQNIPEKIVPVAID